MFSRIFRLILSLLAISVFVGCGPDEAVQTNLQPKSSALIETLNTFMNASLEIDQAGPGPGDANLVLGADVDGTLSYQLPVGGPAEFVDWSSLGQGSYQIADHRLLDTDLASGKDPTSFPQSNECVGISSVLSKMDLRYIAAASNTAYSYFAVLRANNNGDAGYYWLLTRKEPRMALGEAPCKPDQVRLVYDISGPDAATGGTGDVLLAGHFKPNATPLMTVYRAVRDVSLPALAAVNFKDTTVWAAHPADVAAVAINTTMTDPGTFGMEGVIATDGAYLESELFAEAAIPASVFTGGRTCGSTFYGSVITRSSGAGGTSPDLKDLAGPVPLDFGSLSADATLAASCNLSVTYSVSAKAADGTPIASPTCAWTFSDGKTSSTCSGTIELAAGTRSGSVVVTDPATGCVVTATSAEVQVCDPISVAADLTANCQSGFAYAATPSGGCGAGVTYDWDFSGPGSVTPTDDKAASGTAVVGVTAQSYTGSVTVTDVRTDKLVCTAGNSDSAVPYAPLTVNLALQGILPSCPAMSSDLITWNAVASGGNGVYGYAWTGATCSGTSCTVDPSDTEFCPGGTVKVVLSDTSGLCGPATSETETWSKTTVLMASDN